MSSSQIKNNITGIKELEKIFNTTLKYTIQNDHINIDTNINTIKDLELFIKELKKTDIYTNPLIEHIFVKVDILHLHTSIDYRIILSGSESLNDDSRTITRKEDFFVIVYK